ncbi:hypothetical protein HID58_069383 [Brassica napus]|uniref:Uncharacterized protein n=1 Tax=Brassica napus TaxID=3708 RepID=A0ABQ7YVU8_BRANA|nr:hypothetical protein HID58_069383 [Brassica napus]
MRRLLHFWEVRNVKKGEELIMGVNMVLVDDNSEHLLSRRELLREGELYELSGFEVTRSNQNFTLLEAPVCIRFIEQTTMDSNANVPVP